MQTDEQVDTVLFFAPHQDDELLTMGAYAQLAIEQGKDAHVILCTDGSRSCVRGVLNDQQSCSKHGGTHNYELNIDKFSDARDREFLSSCMAIGYRPSRIHFHPQRAIDGNLSVEQACTIIEHYIRIFPNAEICTITPFAGSSQHRDHKNLGYAALSLHKTKAIKKLTLFIEPYCLDDFRVQNPNVKLECAKSNSEKNLDGLKNAMNQYCLWEPENGRYAIGYHSVTNEFDDFSQNLSSWFYRIN